MVLGGDVGAAVHAQVIQGGFPIGAELLGRTFGFGQVAHDLQPGVAGFVEEGGEVGLFQQGNGETAVGADGDVAEMVVFTLEQPLRRAHRIELLSIAFK